MKYRPSDNFSNFSSSDLDFWYMTLTFEPDLDSVKMNQQYKYLGQFSYSLKAIVRTHRHIQPVNCPTWTTKVVGKNLFKRERIVNGDVMRVISTRSSDLDSTGYWHDTLHTLLSSRRTFANFGLHRSHLSTQLSNFYLHLLFFCTHFTTEMTHIAQKELYYHVLIATTARREISQPA